MPELADDCEPPDRGGSRRARENGNWVIMKDDPVGRRRYYRYRTDPNNFAGIRTCSDENVTALYFTDRSLSDGWKPIAFHGFDDDPIREGDFPSLSDFNLMPVASQRAWN